jgi:hypothetical protein
MTTIGLLVYIGSIASVVIVLGLLVWTLQVQMTREMHGEAMATYHSARPRSHDPSHTNSDPVRQLPLAERTRFANDWQSLQPLFASNPDEAVKKADRLVTDVIQSCGYSMGEIAKPAAALTVEHPNVSSLYRETHRLALRAAEGQATADEERGSFEEYRELFGELLGDGAPGTSPMENSAQAG